MKSEVPIDAAGRIVIPKPIRRALHLAAGDRLQLEFAAGAITLRPPRARAGMTEVGGFWVFQTDRPISRAEAAAALDDARAERDRRILGEE